MKNFICRWCFSTWKSPRDLINKYSKLSDFKKKYETQFFVYTNLPILYTCCYASKVPNVKMPLKNSPGLNGMKDLHEFSGEKYKTSLNTIRAN